MVDLGTIRGRVALDIKNAVASYAALRAQNARTVYALRGTGDAFVSTGRTMTVAGAGMVYAFGKVVSAAAEFERKMDYASAVSGATGEQMQRLSDYALQLGQDTIYSAGQIADGFIELAKAGVGAEDIIGGVGKAMTDLAAAADIPLEKSGQIMTSTMQQFELTLRDLEHVTDMISGAANASIADVEDIGVSLKYVGGVAHTAGISFDETATAISILAKAGIRGSTAGTSLRQIITSLSGATEGATSKLQELGIITEDGSNKFFDMQGNVKPLGEVFQTLQDAMNDAGYSAKDSLSAFKTIFNQRALSSVSVLTRQGAKGFKQMYAEMSKTRAAEVASERLDNLSGDVEILRGNIETLMIQAGSPFQEMLRGWVQDLTKLVQLFGDLDPETQKFIVGAIGATGAALIAMGALNIFIGTILKFIAHMLKLAAGVKFLWKIFRILAVNLKWVALIFGGQLAAALGVTTGVLLVIIAAVLAFIAAWVLAYKKIEPFRKAVDAYVGAIWRAIKAVAAFLKLLATDPGAAWEKTKDGAEALGQFLADFFVNTLPGLIKSGVEAASQWVGKMVIDMVAYLAELPGKAASILASFVSMVMSYLTFENAGNLFGTLIGLVITGFTKMASMAISLVIRMVTGITGFMATLAPKVGYAIGFMIGWTIRQIVTWVARMISLSARLVMGMIRFISTLPGRIAGFLIRMVARGLALGAQFARALPNLARQAATGFVKFIATLPGRIATLISNLVNRARNILSQLPGIARQFANGAKNGLVRALEGLPGLVSGILSKVISAFKDVIRDGFNAAKGFAEGLWNGFKDGLGINSPSLIEKQMVQMTQVIDDETKKMGKQTMKVQKLSKQMVSHQIKAGKAAQINSGYGNYMQLASLQSRNLNRSRNLAGSVGKRGANSVTVKSSGPNEMELTGTLGIDESGVAYITGVAENAVDRANADNGRRDRMNHG